MKMFSKQLSLKELQRGASLIEVLLYMALLTLFITTLTGLFTTTIDIQLESQANTSVDRDAQYIFSKITYDMRRATSILTPGPLGTTTSTLILVINGTNYSYATDSGNNLIYNDNTGNYMLNNYDTSITGLTFTKYGNTGGMEDTVRVNLTLSSRTKENKGYETRTYATTIALRR